MIFSQNPIFEPYIEDENIMDNELVDMEALDEEKNQELPDSPSPLFEGISFDYNVTPASVTLEQDNLVSTMEPTPYTPIEKKEEVRPDVNTALILDSVEREKAMQESLELGEAEAKKKQFDTVLKSLSTVNPEQFKEVADQYAQNYMDSIQNTKDPVADATLDFAKTLFNKSSLVETPDKGFVPIASLFIDALRSPKEVQDNNPTTLSKMYTDKVYRTQMMGKLDPLFTNEKAKTFFNDIFSNYDELVDSKRLTPAEGVSMWRNGLVEFMANVLPVASGAHAILAGAPLMATLPLMVGTMAIAFGTQYMYQTAVDGSMVVGLNKVQDYVNGKLSKEELEQYSKGIAADPAGVTTGTAFLDPVRTTTYSAPEFAGDATAQAIASGALTLAYTATLGKQAGLNNLIAKSLGAYTGKFFNEMVVNAAAGKTFEYMYSLPGISDFMNTLSAPLQLAVGQTTVMLGLPAAKFAAKTALFPPVTEMMKAGSKYFLNNDLYKLNFIPGSVAEFGAKAKIGNEEFNAALSPSAEKPVSILNEGIKTIKRNAELSAEDSLKIMNILVKSESNPTDGTGSYFVPLIESGAKLNDVADTPNIFKNFNVVRNENGGILGVEYNKPIEQLTADEIHATSSILQNLIDSSRMTRSVQLSNDSTTLVPVTWLNFGGSKLAAFAEANNISITDSSKIKIFSDNTNALPEVSLLKIIADTSDENTVKVLEDFENTGTSIQGKLSEATSLLPSLTKTLENGSPDDAVRKDAWDKLRSVFSDMKLDDLTIRNVFSLNTIGAIAKDIGDPTNPVTRLSNGNLPTFSDFRTGLGRIMDTAAKLYSLAAPNNEIDSKYAQTNNLYSMLSGLSTLINESSFKATIDDSSPVHLGSMLLRVAKQLIDTPEFIAKLNLLQEDVTEAFSNIADSSAKGVHSNIQKVISLLQEKSFLGKNGLLVNNSEAMILDTLLSLVRGAVKDIDVASVHQKNKLIEFLNGNPAVMKTPENEAMLYNIAKRGETFFFSNAAAPEMRQFYRTLTPFQTIGGGRNPTLTRINSMYKKVIRPHISTSISDPDDIYKTLLINGDLQYKLTQSMDGMMLQNTKMYRFSGSTHAQMIAKASNIVKKVVNGEELSQSDKLMTMVAALFRPTSPIASTTMSPIKDALNIVNRTKATFLNAANTFLPDGIAISKFLNLIGLTKESNDIIETKVRKSTELSTHQISAYQGAIYSIIQKHKGLGEEAPRIKDMTENKALISDMKNTTDVILKVVGVVGDATSEAVKKMLADNISNINLKAVLRDIQLLHKRMFTNGVDDLYGVKISNESVEAFAKQFGVEPAVAIDLVHMLREIPLNTLRRLREEYTVRKGAVNDQFDLYKSKDLFSKLTSSQSATYDEIISIAKSVLTEDEVTALKDTIHKGDYEQYVTKMNGVQSKFVNEIGAAIYKMQFISSGFDSSPAAVVRMLDNIALSHKLDGVSSHMYSLGEMKTRLVTILDSMSHLTNSGEIVTRLYDIKQTLLSMRELINIVKNSQEAYGIEEIAEVTTRRMQYGVDTLENYIGKLETKLKEMPNLVEKMGVNTFGQYIGSMKRLIEQLTNLSTSFYKTLNDAAEEQGGYVSRLDIESAFSDAMRNASIGYSKRTFKKMFAQLEASLPTSSKWDSLKQIAAYKYYSIMAHPQMKNVIRSTFIPYFGFSDTFQQIQFNAKKLNEDFSNRLTLVSNYMKYNLPDIINDTSSYLSKMLDPSNKQAFITTLTTMSGADATDETAISIAKKEHGLLFAMHKVGLLDAFLQEAGERALSVNPSKVNVKVSTKIEERLRAKLGEQGMAQLVQGLYDSGQTIDDVMVSAGTLATTWYNRMFTAALTNNDLAVVLSNHSPKFANLINMYKALSQSLKMYGVSSGILTEEDLLAGSSGIARRFLINGIDAINNSIHSNSFLHQSLATKARVYLEEYESRLSRKIADVLIGNEDIFNKDVPITGINFAKLTEVTDSLGMKVSQMFVRLDPNTVPPEWYKALIYGAGANAVKGNNPFFLIDVGDIGKGVEVSEGVGKGVYTGVPVATILKESVDTEGNAITEQLVYKYPISLVEENGTFSLSFGGTSSKTVYADPTGVKYTQPDFNQEVPSIYLRIRARRNVSDIDEQAKKPLDVRTSTDVPTAGNVMKKYLTNVALEFIVYKKGEEPPAEGGTIQKFDKLGNAFVIDGTNIKEEIFDKIAANKDYLNDISRAHGGQRKFNIKIADKEYSINAGHQSEALTIAYTKYAVERNDGNPIKVTIGETTFENVIDVKPYSDTSTASVKPDLAVITVDEHNNRTVHAVSLKAGSNYLDQSRLTAKLKNHIGKAIDEFDKMLTATKGMTNEQKNEFYEAMKSDRATIGDLENRVIDNVISAVQSSPVLIRFLSNLMKKANMYSNPNMDTIFNSDAIRKLIIPFLENPHRDPAISEHLSAYFTAKKANEGSITEVEKEKNNLIMGAANVHLANSILAYIRGKLPSLEEFKQRVNSPSFVSEDMPTLMRAFTGSFEKSEDMRSVYRFTQAIKEISMGTQVSTDKDMDDAAFLIQRQQQALAARPFGDMRKLDSSIMDLLTIDPSPTNALKYSIDSMIKDVKVQSYMSDVVRHSNMIIPVAEQTTCPNRTLTDNYEIYNGMPEDYKIVKFNQLFSKNNEIWGRPLLDIIKRFPEVEFAAFDYFLKNVGKETDVNDPGNAEALLHRIFKPNGVLEDSQIDDMYGMGVAIHRSLLDELRNLYEDTGKNSYWKELVETIGSEIRYNFSGSVLTLNYVSWIRNFIGAYMSTMTAIGNPMVASKYFNLARKVLKDGGADNPYYASLFSKYRAKNPLTPLSSPRYQLGTFSNPYEARVEDSSKPYSPYKIARNLTGVSLMEKVNNITFKGLMSVLKTVTPNAMKQNDIDTSDPYMFQVGLRNSYGKIDDITKFAIFLAAKEGKMKAPDAIHNMFSDVSRKMSLSPELDTLYEDSKLAHIRRSKGYYTALSDEDAMKLANDFSFTYGELPKMFQYGRTFMNPFISFLYNSGRITKNTLASYPIRTVSMFLGWQAISQLMERTMGVHVDLTSIVPGYDYVNGAYEGTVPDSLNPLNASSPLMRLVVSMYSGVDPFTKRDLADYGFVRKFMTAYFTSYMPIPPALGMAADATMVPMEYIANQTGIYSSYHQQMIEGTMVSRIIDYLRYAYPENYNFKKLYENAILKKPVDKYGTTIGLIPALLHTVLGVPVTITDLTKMQAQLDSYERSWKANHTKIQNLIEQDPLKTNKDVTYEREVLYEKQRALNTRTAELFKKIYGITPEIPEGESRDSEWLPKAIVYSVLDSLFNIAEIGKKVESDWRY